MRRHRQPGPRPHRDEHDTARIIKPTDRASPNQRSENPDQLFIQDDNGLAEHEWQRQKEKPLEPRDDTEKNGA